jgi:HEAT repeat protein
MFRKWHFRFAIGCLWLVVGGCGGNSTGDLLRQLENPDPTMRRSAIRALVDERGDVAVLVPALERVLGDTDTSVRLSAAVALQKIDPANQSFRPLLIESLEAGHAPLFLEVGRMGPDAEWAVPTLVTLLTHPQPQIRALSARALGEIGVAGRIVETALKQRLRDDSAAVRRAAERALEQIQALPAEMVR